VHDAEDLVQETYLRAWRAHQDYEGRSSLRTWLYRIATNVCLTALEHGSRRSLPSGLVAPSDDPARPPGRQRPELPWLQPFPDALLDPADIVAARSRIRLAFVAALQYLPPRQRAVLILRDVLAWRSAEVAELLDTSTAAVNSALQRARAQLADAAPGEDDVVVPTTTDALLDQYVTAFERSDISGLTRLLREDVELEMPPFLTWFTGRAAVAGFLGGTVLRAAGSRRAVRTRANGQPAVATYLLEEDGVYRAHGIQVLDIANGTITRMVAFLDPTLFPIFGLPLTSDRR
jgi:RNA polymerase sigma-70 factor (ECF subfamily)